MRSFRIGKLIAVEGMDGSGKSTTVSYITDQLNQRGQKAICTREVGGTPIAEELRNLAFKTRPDEKIDPLARLLMVYASRIQHIREILEPNIAKGIHVVTDRYNDSTRVYQGVIDGLSESMAHLEACLPLRMVGGCADHTVFIDVDPEVAFSRGIARANVDNDVYKNKLDMAKKIADAYRKLLETRKRTVSSSVFVIDGNKPLDHVKYQLNDFIDYIVTNRY